MVAALVVARRDPTTTSSSKDSSAASGPAPAQAAPPMLLATIHPNAAPARSAELADDSLLPHDMTMLETPWAINFFNNLNASRRRRSSVVGWSLCCVSSHIFALKRGAKCRTSDSDSSVATAEMMASVLVSGHCAYSAQPRNLVAVSSNDIGLAGLPLPKMARPRMTDPFRKVILMIEVILSKPAASASGSMKN